MTDLIELMDARHLVRIAPDLGGGIAEAFAVHRDKHLSLLRPWPGAEVGVLGLGCNVLVPFSNRISGGGFAFEGQFHRVEPNLPGEPHPIHGDGFLAVWQVAGQSPRTVELTHKGQIGPFFYAACLRYALVEGGLVANVHVTNLGPRMPFGGGFHPWFPRYPDTRLQFTATGFWTETVDHLPDLHLALSERPDCEFSKPQLLPNDWINAAFTGWQRVARIEQPALGLAVLVNASTNLDSAVVYSPHREAGFFCFEPVSHAVDAHNQPGQPGLTPLDTGDTLEMSMTLSWSPMELR